MKKSLILFVLLFAGIRLFANPRQLLFDHVELPEGLNSHMAYCLMEDSNGFIWIGLYDGLVRYDGHEAVIVNRMTPYEQSSTFRVSVSALFEDPSKQIWIGTKDGVYIYDSNLETIRTIHSVRLKGETCRVILMSTNGYIIVGTNSGLFYIDSKTEEVTSSIQYREDGSGLSHNTVRVVYEDVNGNLWIGTRDKLNKYEPSSGRIIWYDLLDKQQKNNRNNLILSISPVQSSNDSLLFVGTETGLCLFNTITGKYRHFSKNNKSGSLINNVIKSSCMINSSEVWLGTDKGLNVFNIEKEIALPFLHEHTNTFSISNNVINDLIKDRKGNVWLATDNGVDCYFVRSKGFNYNQIGPEAAHLKPGISVNSFEYDKHANYWFATDEGLIRYNIPSKQFKTYTFPEILHNKVSDVKIDKKGNVWLTTPGGLNKFDVKKNRFEAYIANPKDDNALQTNYLLCLDIDKNDDVWIGSFDKGLFKVIENTTGKISFLNYNAHVNSMDSIASNFVSDVVAGPNNKLWIATSKGVNVLDIQSGKIKHYWSGESKNGTVQMTHVFQLFYGQSAGIWAVTGNGLFKWEPERQSFKYFNEITKPIIAVAAIEGELWFSSFNNLYRYIFSSGRIEKIPSFETGISAYTKGVFVNKDGYLFFGGFEGFVLIDPENVHIDTSVPEVQFTELYVSNEVVKPFDELNGRFLLKKSINKTDSIELKFKENSFTIKFASLDFNAEHGGQYSYMLEGRDKNWKTIKGLENYVSYNKVKPGEYIFKVKAANSYGLSNDDYRKLYIKILPPFYASNWAFVLYFVFLSFILFLSRKFLIARVHYKNNVRYEILKREKSEELVEIKTKFFNNVSHELKTPLTLITTPLEKLLNKEEDVDKRKTLSIMKRNADRLIRLVNQILDLRRIEKGVEELKVQKYDIVRFCRRILNQFEEQAELRLIDLHIETGPSGCVMWFDLEKVEKILFNLLSNAFKFTPDEGHICLSVDLVKQKNDEDNLVEYVSIKVTDTGLGIPKEDQKYIFERFSNVGSTNFSNQKGTGIGLSLVNDYVKLHHGYVSLTSEVDKGTSVIILLPTHQPSIPNEEQPVVDEDVLSNTSTEQGEILKQTQERPGQISEIEGDNKPLVMIVEDDPDMISFLADSLVDHFKILRANDGKEGWKIATKHVPEVIVSDVMMPRMTGIELCKKLKSDVRTSHIPVILLTAKSGAESKMSAIEIGADDYIEKPFSLDYLLLRIKKLIELREELQNSYIKKQRLKPSEVKIESKEEKFMQDLIEVIEKEMDNSELNVKMLSEMMGISHINLYRKIKALTGQTATSFIRNIRLKRAAQLLKSNELNVKEVMYMVGFTHRSYFSQSFKEEFGVAPKDYKG